MGEIKEITTDICNETYEKYSTQIDTCIKGIKEEECTREKKRIAGDLLEVTGTSDFSASEYFMYDFAHKTRKEQSTFLTNKATLDMFFRFNDKDSIDYNTRNKWEVYRRFKPYYHREICLVTGPEHKDDFFALLKDKHRLFCKPLCGSLGEQTRIIKDTDCLNEEAFIKLLEYYGPEGFLAEELIRQSGFMMGLNPTSVNTLRIMTIRMDDRICMYFESRIGEMFSIVDNLDWRSLICGIDEKDGTIISAFNKNRTPFNNHPHTRAKVVGAKIPCFSQAVELAKELAAQFPGYRYLAWDLALTDEGWVIVELNGKGGICGFQEVYNCGIRRDVEGYLSELGKPIDFSGQLNEEYIPLENGATCPHAEYSFTI